METVLTVLIGLHNLFRWVWVLAALLALGAAYSGWLQKRAYTPRDRTFGMIFVSVMDVQLLLGGILYFIGNWGVKAFSLGGGMQVLYFAVEHTPAMLVALVIAHIGSARAKRATEDVLKHRTSAIFFTIAALLVLVAIPWMQRGLLPNF